MLIKAMGNAHLGMVEMQEVMLDTELNMNNWPLTYLDEDIEQSTLTTTVLVHGQIANVLDVSS